ncbi:MAG: DNA-directed RNA polymerase subunit alpha [Candidatus Glassbacteria bacterium]|nr:DNA-directed RNA polymerase subunit alpha [Candidatus Glassbacteria bacterium]
MELRNIVLPSRVEKNTKNYTDVYGEFIVQPLERGFGVTLGNALRRVLISSIEGIAIWALRIDGVLHELSTIPGTVEDMPEIILNLKKVVFRHKDQKAEQATCKLEVKKQGEITAGMIETPASVEVVNKDHFLFSLKEDKAVRIELMLKVGRGYYPASQHEIPENDPQLIAIDSMFSPVTKVSFQVDEQRVGHRTDYDRLTIKVHTNGAISPEAAMISSADLLISHLDYLKSFSEPQEEKPVATDLRKNRLKELFNRSVEELELSVRSSNCLKASNIKTLGELVQKTESEMIKFRNFGRKSLNEISDILSRHGMHFGMQLEKNEKGEWELSDMDEVQENQEE